MKIKKDKTQLSGASVALYSATTSPKILLDTNKRLKLK